MSCESKTIDLLRESGHKMTPQRMMILTSLRHASGHRSAVEIFEEVKAAYPYVDISTVYRTLTVLKDMRIISETHMGGGDATFEWVGVERHHHLICRKCDHVTQIDHKHLDRLSDEITKATGFRSDIDHFAIFGLCAYCAAHATVDLGDDARGAEPKASATANLGDEPPAVGQR